MLCKTCNKRERWQNRSTCKICFYAARGDRNYVSYVSYDKPLSQAELQLLGYWVGRGSWAVGDHLPQISCVLGMSPYMEDFLKKLKIDYVRRTTRTNRWVSQFYLRKAYGMRMEDLGFGGIRSTEERRFPASFMRADYALDLLSGLWAAVGEYRVTKGVFVLPNGILWNQVFMMATWVGLQPKKLYRLSEGKRACFRVESALLSKAAVNKLLNPLY